MRQEFIVVSLSREDLESRGWDANSISEEELGYIASSMGKCYVECGDFWSDMDAMCEKYGVSRLDTEQD